MKRILFLLLIGLLGVQLLYARQLRFVFVSDLHYGLERKFRGREVTANEVNHAMAETVRTLPTVCFPADGGLGAGETIGPLDFVVCGGDIVNRMEHGVQPAAESWREFAEEWFQPGMPELWMLPGNHDISNAIGYPKPLTPARDATSAAEIFNAAMHPAEPRTAGTFDYTTDRVVASFACEGIRFAFVGIWPDSRARGQLGRILDADPQMSCILFTHMPPEAEAQRFTNPFGRHTINRTDGFENLICDTCSVDAKGRPEREYRDLADFLREHSSIRAWFHGHTNYNEFYTWQGPDGDLALLVFRVDSPMKGEYSEEDETMLSFQIVCLDTESGAMTVREYRWNNPDASWGDAVSQMIR